MSEEALLAAVGEYGASAADTILSETCGRNVFLHHHALWDAVVAMCSDGTISGAVDMQLAHEWCKQFARDVDPSPLSGDAPMPGAIEKLARLQRGAYEKARADHGLARATAAIRNGQNPRQILEQLNEYVLGDSAPDKSQTISDAILALPDTQQQSIVGSWNLPCLDAAMPLVTGRVIVVAAAPGCGKTSLVQQMLAGQPEQACFFSMEMTPEDLAARIVAGELGYDSEQLLTGKVRLHHDQVEHVARQYTKASILFGGKTSDETVGWIRAMSNRGCRLFALDYLQIMRAHGKTEYERHTHNIHALARAAKKFRVCLVVLSQLSRQGRRDGEEPTLSDLRGSGEIEEAVDAVCMLWRQEDVGVGFRVGMKSVKKRYGRPFRFTLDFNGYDFREAQHDRQ